MMDSYLRPYFSSSVAQLDFDATLFARALEANDRTTREKDIR
jgi:hypothetical protein